MKQIPKKGHVPTPGFFQWFFAHERWRCSVNVHWKTNPTTTVTTTSSKPELRCLLQYLTKKWQFVWKAWETLGNGNFSKKKVEIAAVSFGPCALPNLFGTQKECIRNTLDDLRWLWARKPKGYPCRDVYNYLFLSHMLHGAGIVTNIGVFFLEHCW